MTTLEPSQQMFWPEMELPSMSSAAGFRAKIFRLREEGPGLRASDLVYGENTPDLLASYDPNTLSWRTSQHSLDGGLTEFSETFPRSGMMQNGIAYQLPTLVRLTEEIASGSSPIGENWPTPTTRDHKDGTAQSCENVPVNGLLGRAVHQWPTPRAQSANGTGPSRVGNKEDLQTAAGGGAESRLGGMAYGLSNWLDEPTDAPRVAQKVENRIPRIRSLGNSVVPQVVALIGHAILEAERLKDAA